MSIITWIRIILLAAGAIFIASISRASLRHPRSHGFYRFFAWELIWILIILNLEGWFRYPLAWHQIISWILLCGSIYPVVAGILLLRRAGRPDPQRSDSPMLGIEKTTQLVTSGVYRYIRHPLYSSLFLLAWGVFFKSPSWWEGLTALVVTMLLAATARAEEGENIRYFGPEYEEYMKRTRMFVPFVF
jgi:protein-S-isoprenylcysteine O-methyltransferase Ste14